MDNRCFITLLLEESISEMVDKQAVVLERGDLIDESDIPLYRESHEEFVELLHYLESGGELEVAYRQLKLGLFGRNESFFMDLFETNEFEKLFELYEFDM